MQLANKQDWARYHSYEVHQMAELVDSHMRPGPWQKIGYFRKVRIDILFTTPSLATIISLLIVCRICKPHCERKNPRPSCLISEKH
jgi:hypothetical protein